MDALYILGGGSLFDNLELKYSLRSLERYGKDIDRVILIGNKPNFLNYNVVEHYPFRSVGVKDFIIASKIAYACETKIVTGDFLFLNDDFFFTKPFSAENFPYYQKGELLDGDPLPNRPYQKHLQLTRDFLKSKAKTTRHFDVHTPIVYNAEKFLALKPCWEYSRNTIGLVVKSVYCNMHGITGPFYNDVKLRAFDRHELARAKSVTCFSCHDAALPAGLGDWLMNEFPDKSKFEL